MFDFATCRPYRCFLITCLLFIFWKRRLFILTIYYHKMLNTLTCSMLLAAVLDPCFFQQTTSTVEALLTWVHLSAVFFSFFFFFFTRIESHFTACPLFLRNGCVYRLGPFLCERISFLFLIQALNHVFQHAIYPSEHDAFPPVQPFLAFGKDPFSCLSYFTD